MVDNFTLHHQESDIYVVPIRHHSPSCSRHLLTMIAEINPAAILVEGPCDFDPLIPLVTDKVTKPPIAIVAIEERTAEEGKNSRRAVSYFPFCAHSPEFVALKAAEERRILSRFIDLPASHRAMRDEVDDISARNFFTDETHFDSSEYVNALCRKSGLRDGNELWDHLFETRLHETDWRAFFNDVGTYCSHIRGCTDANVMEADGTLAREIQMRCLIAKARKEVKGAIIILVGGFHAPVLLEAPKKSDKAVAVKKGDATAYLVRYGNRQLNALNGYSAGLPLPGYYDGLWQRAQTEEKPYAAYSAELISGFATHLRKNLPAFAPSFPVITTALENAHRLANLRGRPGPMRDDILDACRSAMLKGEESGDASPIMMELMAWMTGTALGDVPQSAGSPPLVEAVRDRARSLGFRLDDGERRNRDLDFYRKERHRKASRFLHGMRFLETGFGERTGGPDLQSGVDMDRLHEHWSFMWSPLVEARLIELSADADTMEEALAIAVADRLETLKQEGKGNNAAAAIGLFIQACQAGIEEGSSAVLPFIAAEVTGDPDLATVAPALRQLVQLWQNADIIGIGGRDQIETLIGTAWRRALFLLPNLKEYDEERIGAALGALVTLREVIELVRGDVTHFDSTLFDEAITAMLDSDLHPALEGAIVAHAFLSGHISEEQISHRLTGELGGAYVEVKGRVAYLRGIISISRELLWTLPDLILSIHQALEQSGDDDFLEMLPHLRLTFSLLDPRDIDRLAHIVAERSGGNVLDLTKAFGVSETEFKANLELDRYVASLLADDALLTEVKLTKVSHLAEAKPA